MKNHEEQRFCLEVWGDYACFTRPEMKVERVSYDVITPSAARAVFEAIFWKPAIRWHIREIEVLAPIRNISVRRNELAYVASSGSNGIYIDALKTDGKPKYRQQRAGILLRDVRYRLHAWMEYLPIDRRKQTFRQILENLLDTDERQDCGDSAAAWKNRTDESSGKYLAMFERRAKKGQCFNQPYLGCREFSASFELVEDVSIYTNDFVPISESRDLGYMLYDLDFSDSDNIMPTFFRCSMEKGKIIVPAWNSEEVLR